MPSPTADLVISMPVWRDLWAAGGFPRGYDPQGQRGVDASFWALQCDQWDVPKGAFPIEFDEADSMPARLPQPTAGLGEEQLCLF